MKIKDLEEKIEIVDYENIFNVYEDNKTGLYKYNLNAGLYLNFEKSQLEQYRITSDSFWTSISYQIYGTTRLAWILMKVNGVDGKTILKKIKAGSIIYYIPNELINKIIEIL